MGENYIKWLGDLNKNHCSLAGNKAAFLGDLFNKGFCVPQAFVLTTEAFEFFIDSNNLRDKILEVLRGVKSENLESFLRASNEIKDLIMLAKIPKSLEDSIVEAYDNFNIDLKGLKESPGALAILKSARESVFVSVRASPVCEDLDEEGFSGLNDSFINVKGNYELNEKIKAVFASLFSVRSIFYYKKRGLEFNFKSGIAVIVQRMVNSEKSGVAFSLNPVCSSEGVLIEAGYGQGEAITSGKIVVDQYFLNRDLEIVSENISDKKFAVIRTASGQTKIAELKDEISCSRTLKTHELKQLADYVLKIEEIYNRPVCVEFAIEDNEIFILQSRAILRTNNEKEALDIDGELIANGFGGSCNIVTGSVKIVYSNEELEKVKKGDILVINNNLSDLILYLDCLSGIVFSKGGVCSKIAFASRQADVPVVCGVENALDVLSDGMQISIDGASGNIFSGVVQNKSLEVEPVVETDTKIKVIVGLPKFAQRAAKTFCSGVNFVRIEKLISEYKKHPLEYKKEGNIPEYENNIKNSLKEICEAFIGKPVWVRLSDIRSDELSSLKGYPDEPEKNPILGLRGVRFLFKHLDLFRAELRAIKSLSLLGHKVGVMLPLCVSVEEIRKAKEIFNEEGCSGKVKFGLVIDNPASTILIKDICEEGIDFISFDSCLLTQYSLAVDYCNEDVSYLYDESSWAVLKQISRVIRECKKNNVETSICSNSINNVKLLDFLIKQKIDSVSVDVDFAREVSLLISKIEKGESVEEDKKVVEEKEIFLKKQEGGVVEKNVDFGVDRRDDNLRDKVGNSGGGFVNKGNVGLSDSGQENIRMDNSFGHKDGDVNNNVSGSDNKVGDRSVNEGFVNNGVGVGGGFKEDNFNGGFVEVKDGGVNRVDEVRGDKNNNFNGGFVNNGVDLEGVKGGGVNSGVNGVGDVGGIKDRNVNRVGEVEGVVNKGNFNEESNNSEEDFKDEDFVELELVNEKKGDVEGDSNKDLILKDENEDVDIKDISLDELIGEVGNEEQSVEKVNKDERDFIGIKEDRNTENIFD